MGFEFWLVLFLGQKVNQWVVQSWVEQKGLPGSYWLKAMFHMPFPFQGRIALINSAATPAINHNNLSGSS